MKDNLVMSIASGYKYYLLEPFFRSLRDTGFDGDIVLFYNNLNEKTIKKLKERKVKLIHYDAQKYDREKIHIMHFRFMLYEGYLREYKKAYKNIFLADVRDIYFQKNPFDFNDYGVLNLFCETKKIKECPINSYVFELSSSKKDLEKYKKNNILCAGTTIGTYEAIMSYLKKMNKKTKELPGLLFDQGYHNYLFYSGKLKGAKRFFNFEGPVLTYSGLQKKDLVFDEKRNVINKNGSVINILHQYDRNFYLLFKCNTFWNFILNIFRSTQIKLRRGIKILLFNFPFFGKSFRKRFHDPTRFT